MNGRKITIQEAKANAVGIMRDAEKRRADLIETEARISAMMEAEQVQAPQWALEIIERNFWNLL